MGRAAQGQKVEEEGGLGLVRSEAEIWSIRHERSAGGGGGDLSILISFLN